MHEYDERRVRQEYRGGRGVAPGPPFRGVGPRNPTPTPLTDLHFWPEVFDDHDLH